MAEMISGAPHASNSSYWECLIITIGFVTILAIICLCTPSTSRVPAFPPQESSSSQSQPSHTIIADCPFYTYNSNSTSVDYMAHLESSLPPINHIQGTPQDPVVTPPLTIWLRLSESSQMNETFCKDLATFGNTRYHGMFVGVIANPELYRPGLKHHHVEDIFEEKSISGQLLAYRKVLQQNVLEGIKTYHERYLKLAMVLDTSSCFSFPNLIDKSVFHEFDEIFFKQQVHDVIVDGEAALMVDYEVYSKCRDFVAEKIPLSKSIKLINPIDYVTYEDLVEKFKNFKVTTV